MGATGLGWNLLVEFVRLKRVGARGRSLAPGRGAKDLSLGVVFAASRRVGKCVVGVVDDLELARAGCSFGRVGGDAVGMCLQSGSVIRVVSAKADLRGGKYAYRSLLVGVTDLLCRCRLLDLQDDICGTSAHIRLSPWRGPRRRIQ